MSGLQSPLAPKDGMSNVSPATTAAENAPLFLPGLGPLSAIVHLLSHPKIFSYVQLFLLGLAAEISRRLLMVVLRWIKYHATISSVHLSLDESYDWLMGG